MFRLAFNGRRLTAFRDLDLRVGVWGAAMVVLTGCGSSSSGSGSQGPGQEAGTQFLDAAPSIDSGDGGGVSPGQGLEAGAATDAAGIDATIADGAVADEGAIDATVMDGGGTIDASPVDATQDTAQDTATVADSAVEAGHDASAADTGTAADSGAEAAGGDASVSEGGAVSCASPFGGGPTATTTTHLDIGVHDPSMTWDGTKYFLFATGGTLNIRSSTNIETWSNVGNIFTAIPAWITTALGANPGDLWAPDISYFNGQFHVYYAGSTFGSNSSVIGLATNPTLETSNAAYKWVDQGLIEQSTTADNFNAIDPNVSFDQTCAPWLSFGSFWTGIKLRKLDPTTGKLATDNTTMYSLAERPNEGAIEASSIISHNGYFYLFVSFDKCCDGVNSTYRTMAGRSQSITGPYADSTGVAMLQGGGDQLLATSGRYIGPGGGTAWKDGDTYLYAYHYYDGDDNGNSKLQVRPITFTSDDWITLGDPLFP
jgi:arabinan endo-1,5-alpha-L-arabinosidase